MDLDIAKASSRLSQLELKIVSGAMEIDVLWYRAMSCTADSAIEMHTHSTYEFHFVYQGISHVELDDGSFDIKPGEFYLTAPGVRHRQEVFKGYTEFSLNCGLAVMDENAVEEQYLLDILKNAKCKPVRDISGTTALFLQVLEEAYCQNTGYYSSIKALTSLLVAAAARAISGAAPAEYAVPLKKKKNEYRFSQITGYIHDNICAPVTAENISRHMFLSERQVSRIIMEAAGCSTKEYIGKQKFKEAKQLLVERKDLSIRQISELLGFSSEYYFNQFFKRLEGYPPGVFRNNT